MSDALKALDELRAGNARLVAGESNIRFDEFLIARDMLAAAQSPFAVILGCSDSRVPVELIFDQGLGSLFVIRIAGNIAYPSQLGSVEYAVQEFDTPLVVVPGHSDCGAVKAALTAVTDSMESIVGRIRALLSELIDEGFALPELVGKTVRSNVEASFEWLGKESALLTERLADEHLLIVGAEYSLTTGQVQFFETSPGEAS